VSEKVTPAAESPESRPESRSPDPAFGWSSYAEIINGRFAMIGFVALLLLEAFTRQDFFTWLGLR
jgi:Chlorophyll A-B binding protein